MSAEPFPGHPIWGEEEEATPDPPLPPQQAQGQCWGQMLSFAGPQNAVSKLPSCCLRERGINEASAGPRGLNQAPFRGAGGSSRGPRVQGPTIASPLGATPSQRPLLPYQDPTDLQKLPSPPQASLIPLPGDPRPTPPHPDTGQVSTPSSGVPHSWAGRS